MWDNHNIHFCCDSTLKYFHSDHLDSATLTTNQSGGVYHQIRYNPYGSQDWSSGLDATDYNFTAQRLDGFGLLDYHARYYDATLGRFISPDSVVPDYANPQYLNRYSYVTNRPLAGGDPTGHQGPVDMERIMGQYIASYYWGFWDYVGDQIDNGLQAVGNGLDAVGIDENRVFLSQSHLDFEADIMGGLQGSFSISSAFNPRTGEYRQMVGVSVSFTESTPEGISISAGGGSLGTTETSNMDNLLGSSEIFGGSVMADVVGQVGIAYERSTSTRGLSNLEHKIDEGTGEEITTHFVGLVVGADTTPNLVDVEVFYSPALNYTWQLWSANIYPWNW